MVSDDRTTDSTDDAAVDMDDDFSESTQRGLGIPIDERIYELSDQLLNSKFQPLKLILILLLVVGFVYWALIYLEVLSPFF